MAQQKKGVLREIAFTEQHLSRASLQQSERLYDSKLQYLVGLIEQIFLPLNGILIDSSHQHSMYILDQHLKFIEEQCKTNFGP